MSSQSDAQFDAALRQALAASDPLDDGKGAKSDDRSAGERPGRSTDSGAGNDDESRSATSGDADPSRSAPDYRSAAPRAQPAQPANVAQPKGTHPTVRPPRRSVKPASPDGTKPKPRDRPAAGIGSKLKAGAGIAGGAALGAMTSGMDWKQAVQDPKAALHGLKDAALTQGREYVSGMMDPANLADTVSQARDSVAGAREPAAQPESRAAAKGPAKAKGPDEAKSLRDRTAALKGGTKNINEYNKTHQKMTENLGKSSKGFNDLAKAHRDSAGAQKNIEGSTKKWTGSQDKLNTAVGRSTLGKITAAIQAAIGVVVLLIANWDTVKKAFDTVKQTVLEPIGNFFAKVFGACLAPFTGIIEEVKGVISGLGSSLGGIFAGVMRQVAVIAVAIGTVVGTIDFKLPDWLGGAEISLAGLGAALRSWGAAHMATGGVVRGPGGPRDDLVPIMASNGEFVINAASASRHASLLESINNDTLQVSGRDAQVVASLGLSRLKPAQALPGLTATHRFDRSTTINLTTTQDDAAYARAKAVAAQREVTYAGGWR